ncbi:MAG: S9 family peptidase [Ferruginibacter sp.]|nr:S9 family peptidase [Chitinophagaceae bacterium]
MKNLILLGVSIFALVQVLAQKKPLDHSVYDQWQSISDKKISNDGKWMVYTITPQEGDGETIIQSVDGKRRTIIPRGYNSAITEDSKYAVVKIRAYFKTIREARIKRKMADDMPKDSLAIVVLGQENITKIPRVRSFKIPQRAGGTWVSYLLEKGVTEPKTKYVPDSMAEMTSLSRTIDSLLYVADSLRNLAQEMKTKGSIAVKPNLQKKDSSSALKPGEEGTELIVRNLLSGVEKRFELVGDYFFNDKGTVLIITTTRKNKQILSQPLVLWVDLLSGKTDTIFKRFNEIKNLAINADGSQLAFVAERDTVSKAKVKLFKLWVYSKGMDSAVMRADVATTGIKNGLTVNENVKPIFSRDGKKLYFSLSPIRKQRDTSLVEFETARLDVWNYKDDYLQPQQLVTLNRDLRKGYMAVISNGEDKVVQLGAEDAEEVKLIDEGNSDYVLATSTKGNRVEAQWLGYEAKTAYLVSTKDGSRKIISEKQRGAFTTSPQGKYILWYSASTRQYFTYNVFSGITKNISSSIPEGLYDDEDDHPDDPPSYGTGGWIEKDKAVLINDKYDIWQVDPEGIAAPVNITNGYGRKNKIEFRNILFDKQDLRRIRRDSIDNPVKDGQQLIFAAFNKVTRFNGYYTKALGKKGDPENLVMSANTYLQLEKAENAAAFIVTRASIRDMDLYSSGDLRSFTKMSSLNLQQEKYNWLTAELTKWKMFDGHEAEGLLFKPENFDSTRKYPVIFYFYERNADGLYNYRAPAPSASTINIPYFASNDYLVFVPDIYYTTGQPGEDAYNSIVSAAKYLSTKVWVDSTKLAIQGQSWGGYQVAYLVTRTNIFAAAGAGAPVANMTSAYGGIRWTSGLNRQFQYEHSQSRLGASLWEKPELYIKNSPLFSANKVTTPLLIMHNDADGSVPWYQGIELFTALRRLGKQVWMLQYNGEDHNLVERRNRKDLSIRLSQYFDHFLKNASAPQWIAEGVPATLKGIDWGLEPKTSASADKKSF